MYAVTRIGGNQYRVAQGDTLRVDRLEAGEGELVKFPVLLYVDENDVRVGKDASNVEITAKIVKHIKGDKIDIRRFRAKSRFRRHIGFRPFMTEITIEAIGKSQRISESSKKRSLRVKKTA